MKYSIIPVYLPVVVLDIFCQHNEPLAMGRPPIGQIKRKKRWLSTLNMKLYVYMFKKGCIPVCIWQENTKKVQNKEKVKKSALQTGKITKCPTAFLFVLLFSNIFVFVQIFCHYIIVGLKKNMECIPLLSFLTTGDIFELPGEIKQRLEVILWCIDLRWFCYVIFLQRLVLQSSFISNLY